MDWSLPYPSRRSPVFANNVVATSHPLAAQAGLEMLRRGGNAMDAALASGIALTVLEPCSNGIGSDAFALVWDDGELHALNGSGRSPRAWSAEKFAGAEAITIGWDSITVPGAVAAWVTLSERFGRLAFAELFTPAIRYAEHGFAMSPVIHASWLDQAGTYSAFDGFNRMFLPDGRVPAIGEIVNPAVQARTLNSIARSTGEAFYRGDLARRICGYLEDNGAQLSVEDMAAHRSEWVTPITRNYGDVSAWEIPPNSQGIAVLIALGILQHLELQRLPVDGADSFHLQIEAMKIALRLTHTHVADPAHMRITPDALLDDGFLGRCAASIEPGRASRPDAEFPTDGGTVYLTTADENGMMVSYIQSNFWGFGSGIVVPETGISLQNRAAGFSLEPDHPNRVDGGKLPLHTIIPGFVTSGDHPLMSFGVMGGHMQAQGHVQMITRIFTYGQNPQAASDAPRWFVDAAGRVALEAGFDPRVAETLWRYGHHPSPDAPQFAYGGAQLIYRLDNGVYCAASDHRKDGQAVGF